MADQKPTRHSCKFIDLTGQRSGRLTVVRRSANRRGMVHWECICDCGNTCVVAARHIRESPTGSCGCIQGERSIFGMRGSREYRAYKHAKSRCYNPNVDMYPRYGGRGITMSDEWCKSFNKFFADMGPCPDGMSLNRKDNDGPYADWNCEWATRRTQSLNTSRNVHITHGGKTMTVLEWSEETSPSYSSIRRRHKAGLDPFTALRKRRPRT